MRAWQRGIVTAGIALALTAPAGAEGAPPPVVVEISRRALRQGETARLTVRVHAPAVRVSVRFAGRPWPVYRAGGAVWRTILGTDPTTPPGQQIVAVEAVAANGRRHLVRRELRVVRVAFPRRHIAFDPEQAPLLTREAAERERRRVQEALRVLHPAQLWVDPLALPLEGTVASRYGLLSIYQGQVRGFHGGVDITAPEGTPVRAAGRGIVRLAEALPVSGNAVLVDHGLGVVTSYLHLSEIGVQVNQPVERGAIVGRVGSTGLATGPHLHWGLRVNGVRVDPMPWTTR